MPKLEFPKGFLWGAATSAHQVEGGQHNDWSEWEKANAKRLAQESASQFSWNPHWSQFRDEATNPDNYLSGDACDHYHRYREDLDILQSLHLNAYRFSIEWSRIEPTEGVFDEHALNHYRDMTTELRARGIEPFVTLWHWTLPLWLAEKGGILAPDFPALFARFSEHVTHALGDSVTFWITLNEPEVLSAHAYLKGAWPPQEKSIVKYLRAQYQLISAHRLAYKVIKRRSSQAQIGIATHQVYFEMKHPTFINRVLKTAADWAWNSFFLNRITQHQDFIGLNHYNRNVIDNGYNKNPNEIQTDFGWEYSPDSLYGTLTELARYHKPIYITENGIADTSDQLRQRFIPATLTALHRAIEASIDVRGYLYWSLLDNFEWDKGYWLRFGLVAIDRTTQARTIRPSAHSYAKIAKDNGFEIKA